MDTWLVLGLYVVGILGGAYVGHEVTRMHFSNHINKIANKSSGREWFRLLQIELLNIQLSKFHTQRDEKGRFTKRV